MDSFRLSNLRIINGPKLKATSDVILAGFGTIRVSLFEGSRGPFIRPTAVRSKNGDHVEPYVQIEREFAAAVALQLAQAVDAEAKKFRGTLGPTGEPQGSAFSRSRQTEHRQREVAHAQTAAFFHEQEERLDSESEALD